MKRLLSTILLVVMAISSVLAAPLKNVPCTITQPNGEVIHCFVSGDEFFNYYHDAAGYTIIMNPETGYYTYGVEVNGRVEPTDFIVGQVNPSTKAALVPGARVSNDIIMARKMERERQIRDNDTRIRTRSGMNHGQMSNLIVFISLAGDTVFPKTYSQVEAMFNDTSSSSTVSMKNFYQHVSYNQFSIQSYPYPQAGPNDVIISYHDSHPRSYYMPFSAENYDGYTDADGKREREFTLLENAIQYVKNFIPSDLDLDYDDDNFVDNVVFIVNTNVAGWNDLLWPHRWSFFDRNVFLYGKRVYDFNLILAKNDYYFDIGTLCHEMFHSLSAPDLYAYEGEGGSEFVGRWDLMEQTSNPPQNMGAYMKHKYGHWIDEIPEAVENGLYTIYPVATSPNCAYKIYPDRANNPNQFLVIEYRNTSTPFDGTVYGSGAVIYRINSDFDGNAGVDYTTYRYPEVYAFRKGGTAGATPASEPEPGYMYQSYFGGNLQNMKEFSEYTNPAPFYTNNTKMTGFRISGIRDMGDSLQFYLVKGNITVDTFPWVEPFESAEIPYYCYNEYVNNYVSWITNTGNHTGTIANAHSGNSNAMFYTVTNGTTKLVMPNFDFTFLRNPVLSFWYGQNNGTYYTLKVYYRSSPSDEWTMLQTYSGSTNQWTQATLNLPNPSANYQIAFEAMGMNGTGLVLDDIMVSGDAITDFTITASAGEHGQISPAGNVVVPLHENQTFTLTPEQGYTVNELLVDGVSQQRALFYTFEDVVTDHSIEASFRPATPTLFASPSVLWFSTPGGETSEAQTINVIVGDFMTVDDITVQSEAPFLVSNDQVNYGVQTTIPYNGGMVYIEFAPPFGGTYNTTMTISNQASTATVSLNGSSTAVEEQQTEMVQLYPNPAGDRLNLVFNENELPEEVVIMDVCGRTVLSQQVVDGNVTVNISGLQTGVYFMRANNVVRKFIKK
jgi:M6 family metalloprotease-like protein